MTARIHSKLAMVSVVGGLLLALSGCSAAGGASGTSPSPEKPATQSKTAACAILEAAVSDSAEDLQTGFATLQTDPAGAVTKIQAVVDAMNAGLDKVTNDQVASTAQKASDDLQKLVDLATAALADPTNADAAAITDLAPVVQDDFTAMGEVCG